MAEDDVGAGGEAFLGGEGHVGSDQAAVGGVSVIYCHNNLCNKASQNGNECLFLKGLGVLDSWPCCSCLGSLMCLGIR